MRIEIQADAANTKNIPSLLQEAGYAIPCNCQGAHACSGTVYPFDCSLIPKAPLAIDWEPLSENMSGLSLETLPLSEGTGDTLLIDIGTTTLAFALISRDDCQLLQRSSVENPQRHLGADIISRISSAIQGNASRMKELLTSAIQRETARLCARNAQAVSSICHCYIGGNTTMIHLLMGYDCTPLSQSPFLPEKPCPEDRVFQRCHVHVAPWISAFIGGDICAGLEACRLPERKGSSLFLDLGTNGEMVLCHDKNLYAAATAAGPAFEGGNLTCGCPAVSGAICDVRLRRLQPKCTTIENKYPVGICGSGAISLCAELLRRQYLTPEGIITELFPRQGILLGHTQSGEPLFFTRDDVRNIQLAIAAIAAGIDTLLQTADASADDVRHILLGGGFGFHISPEDSRLLGLFSCLPCDIVEPVGNSCLQGLFRYASEGKEHLTAPRVTTVNLAENSFFQKRFLAHTKFPAN